LAEYWRNVYEPLHVTTKRPSWARDVRSMMTRDILPVLGKRLVKEIDAADVVALHRAIGKRAPARANRVLAVLSHLMGFAERAHVLESGERIEALRPRYSNPCRDAPRSPEEPRQRYLSPAELSALAAALSARPERDRVSVALVRFLLLTGARFGEAATATWDQFDLDRGVWTKPSAHTKQKRAHRVPLSAPALALLHELRAESTGDCLFPGPTGQPITTIKTAWRGITREAGIEGGRLHDLRHSFASVLASGGASLPLIGALLGHSQPRTTARYAHLADAAQREATERAGAVITGQPSAEVISLRRRRTR
jgi:integrase